MKMQSPVYFWLMKFVILFLFLIISHTLYSQYFMGKTRGQLRDHWKMHLAKNPMRVDFNEFDSLITIDVRDSNFKKIDYVYIFGENKKCNTEITLGCDECVVNFFNENVKARKYHWKKQNDSLYQSNFSGGLSMELFKQDSLNVLRVRKSN